MKHRVIWMAGFLMLSSAAAFADMIEVKDRGIMNGKMISQDEEGVNFKDAAGTIHRFSRTEILYADFEGAFSGSDEMSTSKKMHSGWVHFLEKLKRAPASIKAMTDRWTAKYVKAMSKPLDRSKVNAKANALSSAMDTAGKAASDLAKKNRAVTKEIKKQEEEHYLKSSKTRKPRFVSLED